MKRHLGFLAFSLLFLGLPLSAQEAVSTDRVLQKFADKLASVKQLGYKYGFEYSVPSQGRNMKVEADAFVDLQPVDGASRFRFQFLGSDRFTAYNGTEQFTLDKPSKKVYVETAPSFKSFSNTLLMHSPIALNYALPRIIADAKFQRKVSEDKDRYLIEFSLPKAIITAEGEIVEIRPNHTNIYRIAVDKSTLLPVEVVQSNDSNDEVVKTTYAGVTEKPVIPEDRSWFFSTYLNEYTVHKKDKLTLIGRGTTAPNFSLTQFQSAAKTGLDQYKGKVVLLEFWIAHCGFCIAAVPKLNSIAAKFGHHGLQVVSINMYDPAATIDSFKKTNQPRYQILTGGDSIAAAYGVEAYPAIVLIDAQGKVVYSSSGLFEDELGIAIDAALNK